MAQKSESLFLMSLFIIYCVSVCLRVPLCFLSQCILLISQFVFFYGIYDSQADMTAGGA